jgi:membrane-associated phospholipid phosphatase
MKIKKLISENKYFFIPVFVFWGLSIAALLIWGRTEIHLFINKLSGFYADSFFRIITHVGDGITAGIITLLLLFVKFRFAIVMGLSQIMAGGITQLLKRLVFDDMPRPVEYFTYFERIPIRTVEGVEISYYMTFPSGHTTSVFCLMLVIALYSKSNIIKLLSFTLAFLTGYSRMYLSQHFLPDVLAGSLIAIIVSVSLYMLFNNNNKVLDKSLIKFR